jgi:hypothetical protein
MDIQFSRSDLPASTVMMLDKFIGRLTALGPKLLGIPLDLRAGPKGKIAEQHRFG